MTEMPLMTLGGNFYMFMLARWSIPFSIFWVRTNTSVTNVISVIFIGNNRQKPCVISLVTSVGPVGL